MELRISIPTELDAVRQQFLDDMNAAGIHVTSSVYGKVFESTDVPSPGVLGYSIRLELSNQTLAAILGAVVTLGAAYIKSKSSECIKIDVAKQSIEIRGSRDLDRATELLKQLQSTGPTPPPSETSQGGY